MPVGNVGFTILGGIAFLWILLGSWVAIFPGTLDRLFGQEYNFLDEWGVAQGPFTALTLGTLGALAALALIGYVRGHRIRVYRPTPADPQNLLDDLDPALDSTLHTQKGI